MSSVSEENGTAPSTRMLLVGAAAFLCSAFALVASPDPIHGSLSIPNDVAGQEVRLGKEDDQLQKNRRFAASPTVFASTQLQGFGIGSDGTGVGGSFAEPFFMATQNSSLIGYQEPPQGLIPPREAQDEEVDEGDIRTHTVAQGETLSQIAEQYGINVNTILWSNDLGSADLIGVGDQLVILPTSGVLHEVSDGESLGSIASQYEVEIAAITEANGINNDTIFAGQKLIVPGGSQQARAQVNRPTIAATPQTNNTRSTSGYFIRPSAGYLSQGLHSTNAVDIAGACWSPIYASASGSVALSSGAGGWNGGYGNYVAIDHANGTRTLYAHMIQVNVRAGAYINQGAVIGYMGSTGRSTGCHVHFEVRGAANPIR